MNARETYCIVDPPHHQLSLYGLPLGRSDPPVRILLSHLERNRKDNRLRARSRTFPMGGLTPRSGLQSGSRLSRYWVWGPLQASPVRSWQNPSCECISMVVRAKIAPRGDVIFVFMQRFLAPAGGGGAEVGRTYLTSLGYGAWILERCYCFFWRKDVIMFLLLYVFRVFLSVLCKNLPSL